MFQVIEIDEKTSNREKRRKYQKRKKGNVEKREKRKPDKTRVVDFMQKIE